MERTRLKLKPFYVLIMDHDQKTMVLHGPMSDDTKLNKDVVEEQAAGHNLSCTMVHAKTRGEAIGNSRKFKPTYSFKD